MYNMWLRLLSVLTRIQHAWSAAATLYKNIKQHPADSSLYMCLYTQCATTLERCTCHAALIIYKQALSYLCCCLSAKRRQTQAEINLRRIMRSNKKRRKYVKGRLICQELKGTEKHVGSKADREDLGETYRSPRMQSADSLLSTF